MASFSDKQIADAIRGMRKFRAYDYPGVDGLKIAIRCLSEAEADGVEIAALEDLEKYGKKQKWDLNVMADAAAELHQRLMQRHTVWFAVYDAETIARPEPVLFFKSRDVLRDLDSATVTKLYSLYCEHQNWINPLHSLDETGVKELAAALGKELETPGASAALLSGYDRFTLVRLLIALASIRSIA